MNNLPTKIKREEIPAFYTDNEGIVYVSSTYISIETNKRHKHILRDIRNIINSDDDFARTNFGLCQYSSNRNNLYDFYWMTEDGCSVLLGGYSINHRIKIQNELRVYKENANKIPLKIYSLRESLELNIKLLDENEVLVNKNIELDMKYRDCWHKNAGKIGIYKRNRDYWKEKALKNNNM